MPFDTRSKIAPEGAPTASAAARDWLVEDVGISTVAALQIVDYLARARNALGALPTHRQIVLERFFDESGGTQLIIHSPFGSRINKAWGLALRKRFCRTFNFELQAAATQDAIILSLSTGHSFPLIEVSRYLHSATARDVLVQALLDAPLFGVRWRWAAAIALALPRFSGGQRTAPQLQRMKAEDLLAAVFPDQVACLENIVGERQIPEHPLVEQTLHDRGDGCRRLARCAARARVGRDRDHRARSARAVTARCRSLKRATVCIPRRRAARRATHASRADAALERSGISRRPRRARCRRDLDGA